MPVLPNHQPVVRHYSLPSTAGLPEADQAWVDVDFGDAAAGELLMYEDSDNSDGRFLRWLSVRITAWNFTEKDGNPVPISFDTIQRMPTIDYEYLFRKFLTFAKENAENGPEPGLPNTEKKS